MSVRPAIRQLHLLLAFASGIVIFTVAVTGSIYAFEKEIRGFIHKDLYCARPSFEQGKPLSLLIKAAEKKFPDAKIKNVIIPASTDETIQIRFKNKLTVFMNPFSGEVQGVLDMEREFFAVVLKIHRELGLGEPGKIITGISALVFLVIIISGIILWWPKNKNGLGNKFWFQRQVSPRRRNYDLHSIAGFYASWILIFSILTGLIFSFKWAENTLFFLSNSKKEQKEKVFSVGTGHEDPSVCDNILYYMNNEFPDADGYFIGFPEDPKGAFRASVTFDEGTFLKKQHHVFFDQYSGNILQKRLYENASTGAKLRATNYDIHTGEVFGLWGRCLVFIAALTAASLPVTGFMLWFSRNKKAS